MIDNKLQILLNQQCKLLNISKSSLYDQPIKKFSSKSGLELLNTINDIYSEFHIMEQGELLQLYKTWV